MLNHIPIVRQLGVVQLRTGERERRGHWSSDGVVVSNLPLNPSPLPHVPYPLSSSSDVALHDARLDDAGKRQALHLGQQLRREELQIDICFLSPMTRSLETAAGVWSAGTSPPLIAEELLREAFGAHPCDSRRSVQVLQNEFASLKIDWTQMGTNEDTWASSTRETIRDVATRCDLLLAKLATRPERHIALISHGVFLECLLARSGLCCVSEDARIRRFENAEVRSIIVGGWVAPPPTRTMPTSTLRRQHSPRYA